MHCYNLQLSTHILFRNLLSSFLQNYSAINLDILSIALVIVTETERNWTLCILMLKIIFYNNLITCCRTRREPIRRPGKNEGGRRRRGLIKSCVVCWCHGWLYRCLLVSGVDGNFVVFCKYWEIYALLYNNVGIKCAVQNNEGIYICNPWLCVLSSIKHRALEMFLSLSN